MTRGHMDQHKIEKQNRILKLRKLFEALEQKYLVNRSIRQPLDYLWFEFNDVKEVLERDLLTTSDFTQYCEIFKTITPSDLSAYYFGNITLNYDEEACEKWGILHSLIRACISDHLTVAIQQENDAKKVEK